MRIFSHFIYFVTSLRVGAGVALLDRTRPGWALRVDADRLDMTSPFACTGAQVFGNFGRALVVLGLNKNSILYERVWWLGFVTGRGESGELLTRLWKRVVVSRQLVHVRQLEALRRFAEPGADHLLQFPTPVRDYTAAVIDQKLYDHIRAAA